LGRIELMIKSVRPIRDSNQTKTDKKHRFHQRFPVPDQSGSNGLIPARVSAVSRQTRERLFKPNFQKRRNLSWTGQNNESRKTALNKDNFGSNPRGVSETFSKTKFEH